jgi:hypothetical protein
MFFGCRASNGPQDPDCGGGMWPSVTGRFHKGICPWPGRKLLWLPVMS